MAKKKLSFDEIIPDVKDIHLAGKDMKILSIEYGIVKAKIVNNNNTVNLTINDINYKAARLEPQIIFCRRK